MSMPDFFSVLNNVLVLEKKKHYQNQAVAGGFSNFTGFILNHEAQHPEDKELIRVLCQIFNQYSTFSSGEREILVDQILSGIDRYNSKNNDWLRQIENMLFSISDEFSPIKITQEKGLYADIKNVRGIGEKNSKKLNKLGVSTIYDILRFFPRRYQDYSNLKTIRHVQFGEDLSLIGLVVKEPIVRTNKSGKLKIIESAISDSTGIIRLTWFNQPFIANQLKKGMSIIVSGKVDVFMGRLVINNPEWEQLDSNQLNTNRIVPIYPLTAGISQRQIRNITNTCLITWSHRILEYLPSHIIDEEKLISIQEALKQVHFPDSGKDIVAAEKRFAFEEIFFLQLGVFIQKQNWVSEKGRRFLLPEDIITEIIKALPFSLTGAQISVLGEIRNDLNSGRPMNRLLQGDVGSGKTVIARLAMEWIIRGQAQTAVMAPTAILAEQHYRTLRDMFFQSKSLQSDEIALLLGSTPSRERKKILVGLENGDIKVIVGTHALIEDPVVFNDLQLAVIDEQHRFGVSQRISLQNKGKTPHLLIMTATPIPRSLALTIYGDLDISTIDEMPIGRQPVETRLYPPREREQAYHVINNQILSGYQAFIIYPLIESEDNEDDLAVMSEYERISKKIFPMYKVGFLHGKLKAAEKDQVMRDFRDKKFDILISTTVIEVGVDIPNASVVLVEGANRFGLAQLHQIRGRVGRSNQQSYCILIPDVDFASENERLLVMTQTNDGFKLADFDLQQRGPGEFLGSRQSGFVRLRFASVTDIRLIEKCRKYAGEIVQNDANLRLHEHQLLKHELVIHWPDLILN